MVSLVNENPECMEKKTILITGASGGLGTALANWFQKDSYRLVLHYFDHPPLMDESEHVVHIKSDFRDSRQVEQMLDFLDRLPGGVDIILNNAGISRSAVSWMVANVDWDETLAVNLTAPFLLIKNRIPYMRSSAYGRIINVSSVVAQCGNPGTAAYAASKAGLIGLTKTLAKELAPSHITVNALALGYFETGMISDIPNDQLERIIASIPSGRLGSTDTVCKTIEWLLSDEAEYVTGQVINLNGGLHSS